MALAIFRPGDRPLLHFGLLAATMASTFLSYNWVLAAGDLSREALVGAVTFSLSLVFILGSHEMGHYVLARLHRVDTSLPYFIPLPGLGVGTLGAVIRIRSPIPHRNALVDIGAAGPLAGLVVAIPLLVLGLSQARVGDAPPMPDTIMGPNSLWVLVPKLAHLTWAWVQGNRLPDFAPSAMVYGDNLLILGLQRLVLGEVPAGKAVFSPPMLTAAWFGLLVTMLNLLPIGQLDGGHLTHAVFGKRAPLIGKVMAVVMALMCLFCSAGWLVWLVVTTKVIGFHHPEVVVPEERLSTGRKVICLLCAVALVLCFMPVPISQVTP